MGPLKSTVSMEIGMKLLLGIGILILIRPILGATDPSNLLTCGFCGRNFSILDIKSFSYACDFPGNDICGPISKQNPSINLTDDVDKAFARTHKIIMEYDKG